MTTLTRKALYERVWAEPMTKIAADFGVSNFSLKGLCERFDIPTPRSGHWQKKEVGRAPEPPMLPQTRPLDEVIEIEPKRRVSRPVLHQAPPPEASPREHRLIRDLRKACERAKPAASGFYTVSSPVSVVLSRSTTERAIAWLDSLMSAAEAGGMLIDFDKSGARFTVEGQGIPFRIEEKSDKLPHTPTPAELRQKVERERWGFSYQSDPWPKYDHVPSGRLSIQIDANPYSGLRRSFADGKTQKLEGLIEGILEALQSHAAFMIERKHKAELARQRAAEEQRHRDRRNAFAARETRRSAFVGQMVEALDRRADLKRVLDHVESWDDPACGPFGLEAFLQRRLAEEEARLSPVFLELSARAAKIEFDEAKARQSPDQPRWAYPSAIALDLWRMEIDRALSVDPLTWAEISGFTPPWEEGPDGELDPDEPTPD